MAYTDGCLVKIRLNNGKVVAGKIESIFIGLDSNNDKSVSLIIDTEPTVQPVHIWLDSIDNFL